MMNLDGASLMNTSTEKIIAHYSEAYQRLYKRQPRDLRMIDHEWIIVNGARIRVNELEYLTKQLQIEYKQGRDERKNMVQKLVKWFKGY
jgi:glutamine cyclotransferase